MYWEYKIIDACKLELKEIRDALDLDDLGRNGWELCAAYEYGRGHRYFFRRLVTQIYKDTNQQLGGKE